MKTTHLSKHRYCSRVYQVEEVPLPHSTPCRLFCVARSKVKRRRRRRRDAQNEWRMPGFDDKAGSILLHFAVMCRLSAFSCVALNKPSLTPLVANSCRFYSCSSGVTNRFSHEKHPRFNESRHFVYYQSLQ